MAVLELKLLRGTRLRQPAESVGLVLHGARRPFDAPRLATGSAPHCAADRGPNGDRGRTAGLVPPRGGLRLPSEVRGRL
jgi:hypothetical protein